MLVIFKIKQKNDWRFNISDSSCFTTYPNNNELLTFQTTSTLTQPVTSDELLIENHLSHLRTFSDGNISISGNLVYPVNPANYVEPCNFGVEEGGTNDKNRLSLHRSLSMDFAASTIGSRRTSLHKSYSDLLNVY